jgi:hypothetical protein
MHTYLRTMHKDGKTQLYTVGSWAPSIDDNKPAARWIPIKDFKREKYAACFVSFLNGGEAIEQFMITWDGDQ